MKTYVGDIGTEIILECGMDISDGTGYDIAYKKPDGAEGVWNGALEGTTQVKYTTVEGDLDQAGDYRLQPLLTLTGWVGRGETAIFPVFRHWE
ncbi:hypothetical protein DRQ25_17145 [Candidatus Fermentibacteria bacterium]|nr:MAG: hypothetical protein DRQ25_17145 [Candidatus Fermentibacteria bacterium]